MSDLTLSQVLDRAADVIERNGHHKHTWYADPTRPGMPVKDCRVCEGGAINLVVTGGPVIDTAYDDIPPILLGAYRVMAARHGYEIPDGYEYESDGDELEDLIEVVTRWNDHSARTGGEVAAELRAAAAELRAEGE